MNGNKVQIKVICTKVMYCNLDQVPLDYIINKIQLQIIFSRTVLKILINF